MVDGDTGVMEGTMDGQAFYIVTLETNICGMAAAAGVLYNVTSCPGNPDIPLWPSLASLKGIIFQQGGVCVWPSGTSGPWGSVICLLFIAFPKL